ncbi:hypothetical protein V1478_002505 [Vespula squamosa]|uniref:Uncharacterized protein n=1 Tax=Vespula squamosa TaxID=30214 RepID=A0ABD2BSR9_VESSQ
MVGLKRGLSKHFATYRLTFCSDLSFGNGCSLTCLSNVRLKAIIIRVNALESSSRVVVVVVECSSSSNSRSSSSRCNDEAREQRKSAWGRCKRFGVPESVENCDREVRVRRCPPSPYSSMFGAANGVKCLRYHGFGVGSSGRSSTSWCSLPTTTTTTTTTTRGGRKVGPSSEARDSPEHFATISALRTGDSRSRPSSGVSGPPQNHFMHMGTLSAWVMAATVVPVAWLVSPHGKRGLFMFLYRPVTFIHFPPARKTVEASEVYFALLRTGCCLGGSGRSSDNGSDKHNFANPRSSTVVMKVVAGIKVLALSRPGVLSWHGWFKGIHFHSRGGPAARAIRSSTKR